MSTGALGGFVVEAGLSAAGAALGWLATLTGVLHDDLLTGAATVDPGADGLLALPWLSGARGPWWQAGTHGAFLGLTEAHGPAAMARAVLEGVALDVARCVELVAPGATAVTLAGAGAGHDLWREILGGVTGLPRLRRALPDAASVGARLVVAAARGETLGADEREPVRRAGTRRSRAGGGLPPDPGGLGRGCRRGARAPDPGRDLIQAGPGPSATSRRGLGDGSWKRRRTRAGCAGGSVKGGRGSQVSPPRTLRELRLRLRGWDSNPQPLA